MRAKSCPYVGQSAPGCPALTGGEVSVTAGGAEPVDVPPAPEPSPGEPAQPAAAASTPPVSAAAASLAVRVSLIRIPQSAHPAPRVTPGSGWHH